jgi:peptide-methionine (S)-S-oxide reductase
MMMRSFLALTLLLVFTTLLAMARSSWQAVPRLAGGPRLPDGEHPGTIPGRSGGGPVTTAAQQQATAIFAGGCFWCMEEAYEKVPGVLSVVSGYTGGHVKNPSYEAVSSGGTGHAEAVRVTYDPARVSYEDLLRTFWTNIDPTTPNRQFCDVGEQYRAAIFVADDTQRRLAEGSKLEVDRTKTFTEPVVTEIRPAAEFYPAEDYHQDYYKKNPVRYKFYKYNCGRSDRLADLWGKDE